MVKTHEDLMKILHMPSGYLKIDNDIALYYEKDEDVLSYALLPQVALKFFEKRKNGSLNPSADGGTRTLYVEDLSE